MAGERRGKGYEAVVLVALEELRSEGVFTESIYWEETPVGMSIKPDITIGSSKNEPSYYLLITNSGAAGNSDMKSWRNLGELVEAKTCLPTVPRVFALTFGTIKEDLEPLQQWAFDEFRWERGSEWHKDLDSFVSSLIDTAALKVKEFPIAVRDRRPIRILAAIKAVLQGFIEAPARPQMVGLWNVHRARTLPSPPARRETNLRRGLAKLLIFEDLELGASIHENRRVPKDQIPDYAYELGLAKKSITEGWGADSDIESAVKCLGHDGAIAAARMSMKPKMDEWYYTLRNRSLIPHLANYIRAHVSEIRRPQWLWERLQELHDNPSALVRAPMGASSWPPPTVWLFELLMQLIRAATGSANGYGYAQLSEEVLSKFGGRLKGGGQPRWFRIVLPDWIHRRGNEVLDPAVGAQIAFALCNRLSTISDAKILTLLASLANGNAEHIINQKLIPYRMFDPLSDLLRESVPDFLNCTIDVCYREAAGVGGQAGRVHVGMAKNTLINWQSCSDAGRDHKKKELCGRGVAMRYHWNGNSFVLRPGIKKLLLLLDGTWRQEDLAALVRAGWDDIFYPDEIDKLVKAIV